MASQADLNPPAPQPDPANDAARLAQDAQQALAEAARRIETAVQEGLAQLRSQSQVYADVAGQQLEEAQRLVSEQVRQRPVAAMGAALGVGVLVGLLIASAARK